MSKRPEEKEQLAKAIAKQSKNVKQASQKVEGFFGRVFRFVSNLIDRIFFKPQYGGIVSLVIAVLLYLMVASSGSLASSVRSSMDLNRINVEVLANNELYEITGLPETVDAIVQGELVDLTTTRNQGNYSVVADLVGLTEGTHFVRLEARNFSPRVRVTLSPANAEITIRRKISETFTFDYDFINKNKMSNEYVLGEPVFDVNEVVVQASQETINQIAYVKALIDVAEKTETFTTEARLVAYNQSGMMMDIDVLPEVVNATVEVSSPNKQVPLVVKPIGNIPNNMSIASVELETELITIYGPEDVLTKVNQVEIPINASTLTESTNTIVHSISLPEGIRAGDVERVRVVINLSATVEKIVKDSHVFFENNVNNYKVEFVNQDDALMDVKLIGSQELIDAIDLSQLRVSIDMRNLALGQQEVGVKVTGPSPFVTYQASQAIILIDVKE